MKQILDLHIHSKYSRACSRDLTLANIDRICRIKGVDIIATGDFTHPAWFRSIKEELQDLPPPPPSQGGGEHRLPLAKEGVGWGGGNLFRLKTAKDDKIKFILSTEISLIYKDGEKTRRLHIVVHAPNLEAAEELNTHLEKSGFNIKSDGRPILGMKAPDLARLCLKIHPHFLIYPAHIWTPWYSVFGSKSGFDSMEECFKDQTSNIFAIETGLSSDPEMNWRWSALDKLTIISNSDAHSLPNIGREANIFEMSEISYRDIYEIIRNKLILDPRLRGDDKKESGDDHRNGGAGMRGLKGTIEFYPEEGMYHFDGHRACGVSFTPEASKKHHNICPVCKKPLVIGVLNRVEELADRPSGRRPEQAVPYFKLVELDKIIAEAFGIKSRYSKQVKKEYDKIIRLAGNELDILMNVDLASLKGQADPLVVEGIERVREGKLAIKPGFDGVYGIVRVFGKDEVGKQGNLF
jgi:DNA helicase II / ATP-dependent DNA helicase PcrA